VQHVNFNHVRNRTTELLTILERLDIALDNGRTEETEADLDRAQEIIRELKIVTANQPS
jgi:flagellin-specific chaperone FliS